MRCYICDKVIDDPIYDENHQDYQPCEGCMAIINDLVEGDKDNVTAADDELTTTDATDVYLSWLLQDSETPEIEEEFDLDPD